MGFLVIRDTREKDQQGWIFQEDGKCEGTIVRKLDTADYTIQGLENYILIERKHTVSELATNIQQKRFERELQRLSVVPQPFIICEFSLEDLLNYPVGSKIPKRLLSRIRITGKFIYSTILTYLFNYHINILFCNNSELAKYTAYKLLKMAHEK